MNYPIYSRRIWAAKARKERPSADFAANVLDPTVARRATQKKLRYRPAPLRPFRTILPGMIASDEAPQARAQAPAQATAQAQLQPQVSSPPAAE
jgi:transposase InsO family protein